VPISAFRAALPLAFLALVCAAHAQDQPASDQSSQSQSLGDIAKANRQKKSAAKVIDEEDMSQRRLHRGAGNPALECDESCATAVRAGIEKDPRLHMTDAEWQTSFVDGQSDLTQDADWSQLFTEIQGNVCHRGTSAADPDKIKDLDRRVGQKIIDEVRETMTIARNAMQAGTSKAAQNEAIATERTKAVKLLIIKVQVERAKRACVTPAVQKSQGPN